MPRANRGEAKEGTGATGRLPASQSKHGPQQKRSTSVQAPRFGHEGPGESESYLTSGDANAKWHAEASIRASII